MEIVIVRDVKNSSQLEVFLPPTGLIIEVIRYPICNLKFSLGDVVFSLRTLFVRYFQSTLLLSYSNWCIVVKCFLIMMYLAKCLDK